MRRVIDCAVTVIVILSLLILGMSCSAPAQTTPKANQLTKDVEYMREQSPTTMADHNGYLIVSAMVIDSSPLSVILAVQVSNKSSTILYTNPSYFVLIDALGTAHQYDSSSTYSFNNPFAGISLPPGTHAEGALIFGIDISTPPKSLVYSDGETPPITMGWRDNSDIKQ